MQTKLVKRFIVSLGVILLFAGSGNGQEPKPRIPSQPQPVTKKLPSYPPIARAACAQGSVAVLVEIDTTGKVAATDVLYGHPLLRRVAEASAHEWTFDASKEELGEHSDFWLQSLRMLRDNLSWRYFLQLFGYSQYF